MPAKPSRSAAADTAWISQRFTTENVYAITDLRVHEAKPAQNAAWIRPHWHVENQIHWVRDVTYDEDRSQIRTGTGPRRLCQLNLRRRGIVPRTVFGATFACRIHSGPIGIHQITVLAF
jgi:hypothetical protein